MPGEVAGPKSGSVHSASRSSLCLRNAPPRVSLFRRPAFPGLQRQGGQAPRPLQRFPSPPWPWEACPGWSAPGPPPPPLAGRGCYSAEGWTPRPTLAVPSRHDGPGRESGEGPGTPDKAGPRTLSKNPPSISTSSVVLVVILTPRPPSSNPGAGACPSSAPVPVRSRESGFCGSPRPKLAPTTPGLGFNSGVGIPRLPPCTSSLDPRAPHRPVARSHQGWAGRAAACDKGQDTTTHGRRDKEAREVLGLGRRLGAGGRGGRCARPRRTPAARSQACRSDNASEPRHS